MNEIYEASERLHGRRPGTKYMASGYVVSGQDGAQISLYSGGVPETHGGGGAPGTEGLINIHSGVKRHVIRRGGARDI